MSSQHTQETLRALLESDGVYAVVHAFAEISYQKADETVRIDHKLSEDWRAVGRRLAFLEGLVSTMRFDELK